MQHLLVRPRPLKPHYSCIIISALLVNEKKKNTNTTFFTMQSFALQSPTSGFLIKFNSGYNGLAFLYGLGDVCTYRNCRTDVQVKAPRGDNPT